MRLAQAGFALLLMALSVGVMHYAGWVAGTPLAPLLWWSAFSLGGLMAVYAAIRSGWSLRLQDPSLTLPQMIYAIGCARSATPWPARCGRWPCPS